MVWTISLLIYSFANLMTRASAEAPLYIINETYSGGYKRQCGSCEDSAKLGPPPDMLLTIPPPPIPQTIDIDKVRYTLASDGKCHFCEWAISESNSVPKYNKGFNDSSWVLVLTSVGVTSTVIGAIFVILLIKCKKFQIFPVSEACPILTGSGKQKKHDDVEKPSSSVGKNDERLKPLVHLWNKGPVRERPLHTPSSQSSEANSYSGEPYRTDVVDSQPVYSEINSRSDTSSTIYSEVAEQPNQSSLKGPTANKLLSDGSYENAAYLTSEYLLGLTNGASAGNQRIQKHKKPRPEPLAKPHNANDKQAQDSVARQESPYYYKTNNQTLPARKPLPPLPSQRVRSLPRRPLPTVPPPPPAMV